MSKLTASRAALDLIQSFEGFRAKAARLPDGRYTIGFGHVATAREGLEVTHADAADLLRWDLRPVEDAIRQWTHAPLNQHQFDALVSLAFNIGLDAFRASDVLAHVNRGEPVAAALAMGAWRRARVNGKLMVVDALVRRRAAEAALFLEPPGPRPAAPSSVVRPEIDYAAALLAPAGGTVVVDAPLDGPATPAVSVEGLVPFPGQTPPAPERLVLPEDTGRALPVGTASDGAIAATAAPAPRVVDEPVLDLTDPEPQTAATAPQTATPVAATASKPLAAPRGLSVADPALSPFPGERDVNAANGAPPPPFPPANDPAIARPAQALPPLPPPASATGPELNLDKARMNSVTVAQPASPADWRRLGAWIALGAGAALLAGGLWHIWQAGYLAPATSPRLPMDTAGIAALVCVAMGFVTTVAAAVRLTGPEEN